MKTKMLLAALLIAPSLVAAEEYKIGDLMIAQPLAKTTPATAMAGAGYLSITNMGDTTDSLIGVEADFPRVEIHDTKVENDVASMFQVEGIEIAPGESITMMPGGKHVMFMGLNGDPFEEGEEIAATLIFENAGRIDVMFDVATLTQITGDPDAKEAKHGGHGHGDDDAHDHD